MTSREVKKDKMGDDPPYLAVGTDVSAKYKGAFCEAKVRKVVRVVKCKVHMKNGGVAFVTDDQIKGNLRIGTPVEVKLPDKKDYAEANITSIKDLSQYTVVFDDGDITTLRRTALCLKSGRHFAESETLDQLPLTHPEHFSTPVIGASRRGRRRLGGNEDSSDEEGSSVGGGGGGGERQREADIGKVVCVEISEKKKVKDNWFPGLIVAPNAQDAVRIHVDEDYLVRSFKDGRYFTVPKKEATEFTREIGLKVDSPSLKQAVEKALVFLDKDELPPHWDRELLFGLVDSDLEDDDDALDSDSSDDEPREEKDHFVAQLYKFMDDRGTPINKGPVIQSRDVDLYRLFRVVHKLGGYNRVTNQNQWKLVTHKMSFGTGANTVNSVKHAYKKFLHSFEDFYRKLGCTMVNHPRSHRRPNSKSNRSLIRDRDRATPHTKEPNPGGPASSGEPSASRDPVEVKVEVKREEADDSNESRTSKKDSSVSRVSVSRDTSVSRVSVSRDKPPGGFEAKRDRHVKEEAQRRERTRDKTYKESGKDSKDVKDVKDVQDSKEESIAPPAKKRVEENLKLKVDERPPKSSIGILAKFSYRKEKPGQTRGNEEKEKDRMNRVKKSLGKGSGLMERQKRTIKDTVKALAKTLGFGGKASGASVSGNVAAVNTASSVASTRKVCAVTTASGSGEDEDRKKPKEEVAVVPSVEKRASSGTRSATTREDTAAVSVAMTSSHPPQPSTPPVPPPARKSSLSGEDRRSRSSRSRRPEDEGSMEPASVSSNPGETSDGLTLDIVSPHKWISVGDKLRVYYGPNHKSKVTYEAKVVATRQEGEAGEREYLVHYTGWNTRYDEWIRRNRIAENLAWNTTTSQQQQNKESCSPGISSSSRNKSTPRRSSTRTSARNTRPNTDDSESDKESEGGSESETEIEANSSSQNRSMRSRRILSDDEKKPAVPSPGTKTRSNRKCKTDEEEEEGEKLKEKQEEEEDKKKLPLPEAERKSLRLSQRKKQEVEHEKRLGPESDSGSDSESQEDSKAKVLEIIEPLDDVYEFKEPEPFTFSKQKKTISPPGPSGQKGKKNIGLFEDYDNLDEENEDIHVAIQRVMDTCDENQMDLDLLDSNSSDSNSSDSNSMCEMMKKRLQSEINTYEGPKSKLKGRGEESIPPMRTRRSSESKSSKMSGEEKGKLPVVRPKEEKVLDETQVEKPNEQMKNETDSVLAATRSKKSEVESSTPKSKRSEAESAASKVKKPDTNPAAGNKSKKAGELESVPSPKGKKPLDTDTIILKAKKSESENITTPKTKKSDVDTNIVACPKLKKSDLDTEVSLKFKKSDSDNSIVTSNKAKKSELDVSNKTKKSDIITITSSKAKKILDWETVSGPKAKKSEVDINESTSPGKTNKKIETPETNMKTRLKTESRCSSPGSKTRSKSELTSSKTDLTPRKTEPTQKEEVPIIPETNMADNKQSTSPLPSAKQEKAKPPVLENRTRVSSPSKKPSLEVKLHNISKSAELVKPIVSLATKVSDNVEATILAVSSLITPALPATLQSKPICHSEPQDSTEGFTKLSLVLEAKKQDLLFLGSKMTPKAKPKVIPSFSPQRSHTDFSAQTEPLEIDKDRNILTSSSLPKLPDIPVLQRIESVVLKTPIKREPIDPTKIDLIKVSPNMPQLEKIDTMDVIETATPVKKEETTVQREDLKFPPFQFEDVLETPEKIFLPAVDTESEANVRPDTIAKPDKKIEFKMKPKAVSPCGFSKTERARKLVRQRLDEAESPTKTVSSKEKKPSQTSPQVKKYGPACKPDSSNVSSTDAVNTNIKTKVQSDVESKDNRPPVPNKLKETSPLLVGKTKELPAIVSPKVKETSPGSSKVKDSPTCVSSKFKESSPIRSNKNKDTTTAVSTKKDSTLSPPKRTRDISSCLSDKIKDCSSSPVPIKSKDGSVIILSKGKDTPAVVPDKNKDTLLTVIKSKESTPTCANKIRASTPVLLSKEKESDLQQPNKPRDAIIVSSSSKESMDGEFTIEIDTKSEDAKSSPPTGKQVVDVKNIEEVEIKCEPETSLDTNKEGNKKQKEESKLSNAPESNIKVEESTELVRNESEDPHTSKEVEQSKTPEKEKDVEKGKSKEDIDEDAVKREEKSKELSSVFEFDETLEDEIVDLESESYLASSKRKLAALIDSPGSEFMSNKLAKLNELEKLKQKLFMDCSGEGEDLEEKADGEKKEEEEGKPDTALLELTADETLEEEVDNTLLCKETIPGSPTPYQDELNMIMELPPTNSSSGPGSSSSSTASHSANAVLDNTPPTTPESSLSPPRNECTGVSGGSGVYAKIVLGGDEREGGGTESPKKTLSSTPMKRRSSQTERSLKKRLKQSPRNTGPGSDSDDLSISEPFSIFSPTSTDITKSKYSYFVELDPELDQAQRIAVVQQKLQDLRKEYLMYKQELVTIDRRRKKIRRRERENKKNNVSAPPAALPSV